MDSTLQLFFLLEHYPEMLKIFIRILHVEGFRGIAKFVG